MHIALDVWSDYVCPFCYLEAPVLAKLAHEHGERVRITWRAFELRPEPVPTLDPSGAYLREIWAAAVYPMAHARAMTLRLPPVQPRSRLAHEAAQFAALSGCFELMNTTLFRAFFEDGNDIGDGEVLANLARGIGLDGRKLLRALEDGRFRGRVIADEKLAREFGIGAVPSFLIRREDEPMNQAIKISGAQPYEVLADALEGVSSTASR